MATNEKVALVTGAGTGIGKYCSLALLTDGYSVTLAGRRLDKLQSTLNEAGDLAKQAIAISADVGDPESVKSLFKQTKDTFGRLDLLFNNAGLNPYPALLEDLTFEQWQVILSANLTGTFLCTQEAFKIMKTQAPMGGRIINNGSISAQAPRPNSAPYTATKHGVTGLTKSTALDGRKYNIACSQIDIGNAHTEMTDKMAAGVPQADGSTQVEPTFDVNHVAEAVLYIANLPLEANVQFMNIMATKMPFVGRG